MVIAECAHTLYDRYIYCDGYHNYHRLGGPMMDIELVARREDVLSELIDGAIAKRDLVDRLGTSRSTVDRAIRELENAVLVERRDGGYAATMVGRLALECYQAYRRESRHIFESEEALSPLPADCDLPLEFVCESKIEVASDPAPYRPMERIHDAITEADEFRILLPVLYDPRFLERCYVHAVEEGNSTSMVVDESVVETARKDFPDRTAEKMACEWFSAWTGETPPYGLLLTTHNGETGAFVVVFGESLGPVHAVLETDSPIAVQWAERRFRRCVEAATASENAAGRGIADGGRT